MRKYIALFLICALLAGCAAPKTAEVPPAPTEEQTPTVSAPTFTPVGKSDGNPASPAFANRYEGRAGKEDAVAAAWGEEALTLAELRAYYALMAGDFPKSDAGLRPEDGVPLWAQVYPASTAGLSWEQLFLVRAISLWQAVTALNYAAAQPRPAADPGYSPDEGQHAQYISEDMPAAATVYGDKPCYEMPAMHRAFTENLASTLQGLAQARGYGNLDAFAAALGTDAESLLSVCTRINRAYSYYVELNSYADPDEHATDAVDIRQILILPEGSGEAAMEKAVAYAEGELSKWQRSYVAKIHPEASFANLAHEISADETTACDGGSLNCIKPGQLLAEPDAWCFAAERQPGDTAVIPTEKGVSILYFVGESASRSRTDAMAQVLSELADEYVLRTYFDAVSLQTATASLGLSDILYPDVGHEQIDEIPTFFQQDYPSVNCNGVSMPVGGCGFTSLAMLATYLSDSLITPTQMAERYAKRYGSAGGTDGDIFSRVTPEMGFYLSKIYNRWEPVEEAMSQGKQVINLQMNSPFTKGGHYILLAHLREDGTVVVRDPSITHYTKLSGFREGAFDPAIVKQGATQFWVFDEKILTIPACNRCGGGGCYALQTDYLCRKCLTATDRRDSFVYNALTIYP